MTSCNVLWLSNLHLMRVCEREGTTSSGCLSISFCPYPVCAASHFTHPPHPSKHFKDMYLGDSNHIGHVVQSNAQLHHPYPLPAALSPPLSYSCFDNLFQLVAGATCNLPQLTICGAHCLSSCCLPLPACNPCLSAL